MLFRNRSRKANYLTSILLCWILQPVVSSVLRTNHNRLSWFKWNLPTFAGKSNSILPALRSSSAVQSSSWSRLVKAFNIKPIAYKLSTVLNGRYSDLRSIQKLATTPVYYISSPQGYQYQFADPDDRNRWTDSSRAMIPYFMSAEDALWHLNQISMSARSARDYRLMATSLEKVVETIILKKQGSRIDLMPIEVVHRIQPSSRQCSNAATSEAISNPWKKGSIPRIPVFSFPGLNVETKYGESIKPYYFAYEDLVDDLKTAGSATIPKVLVSDLSNVLAESDLIDSLRVKSNGISWSQIWNPRNWKKSNNFATAQIEQYEGDNKNSSGSRPSFMKLLSRSFSRQEKAGETTSTSLDLTITPIKKIVGIVPPRREIDFIRDFYRGKRGVPNEFSTVKVKKFKNTLRFH